MTKLDALLICYLCVCIFDAPSCAVIWIFCNPFLLSIGPWMIVLILCLIVTYFALDYAMHLEFHSLKIDTRELCVRLGMICLSHDSSGKYR